LITRENEGNLCHYSPMISVIVMALDKLNGQIPSDYIQLVLVNSVLISETYHASLSFGFF
jgi:hypothetical protein